MGKFKQIYYRPHFFKYILQESESYKLFGVNKWVSPTLLSGHSNKYQSFIKKVQH